MELKAAAKRILWHTKLLLLFIALGVAIPTAFLSQQGSPVATTRIVMTGVTDRDHAASAAGLVSGIATSESQLRVVLADQLVRESASSLARRISATPIGSSGVVQISVTDRDPAVAAGLANAVTQRVVAVIRETGVESYPLPRIVQSATAASATPPPTQLPQMVILGALAGLVIGLLFIALLESLSPTVVGRDAIGDEFGAPVLEVLPRPPGVGRPSDLSWLRWQLDARARSSRVNTIELAEVGRQTDLLTLAEEVEAAPAEGTTQELVVRPLDPGSFTQAGPNRSPGLVVVVPKVVKLRDVRGAKDVAEVAAWPLLGVIAYEPSRHGSLGSLFTSARRRAKSRDRMKIEQVA